MTCLFLVFVEKIGHLLNRLVVASISTCGEGGLSRSTESLNTPQHTAEDNKHADSILINKLHRFFGVKSVVALDRNGNEPALDFEIPGEFLKGDLGICTHYDVWARFMNALASGFSFFLPDPLHGKTTKLNGLRRASGGCPDRLLGRRCVPEIGKNRYA